MSKQFKKNEQVLSISNVIMNRIKNDFKTEVKKLESEFKRKISEAEKSSLISYFCDFYFTQFSADFIKTNLQEV